jgi:hypothetical protein
MAKKIAQSSGQNGRFTQHMIGYGMIWHDFP